MKRVVWLAALGAMLCAVMPAYANDESLNAHVQALRTGNEQERLEAALALFDLGPRAKPAVPALADALYAPKSEIKLIAVAALAQLGPEAVEAAAALASRLDDPDEAVRTAAMAALQSVGRDAAPALLQVSENGNSLAKHNAQTVLETLEVEAAPRLLVLVAGLHEEDFSTQATRARGRLEHLPIAELVRTLRAGEDDTTCYQAISALGRKGPDALPAIRDLAKALRDTEAASDVRLVAAWAIGQIGREAKPAENLLISSLVTDPYVAVRAHAAQALGKIGADSQSTIEALTAGLSSEDSQLRGACATALFRMGDRLGEKGASAIEPLAKMLDGKGLEPYIAVTTLGGIGRAASPAVPNLTPLLANQYADMRGAAAYALGRIGPASVSALPALRAAAARPSDSSKDPATQAKDAAARDAATRAIAQIERHQRAAVE